MVSTEAEDNDQRLAYACGANLYLIKPVKPDRLLARVRVLLGELAP
jgi:two-component system chemotaxis response regulator CheY